MTTVTQMKCACDTCLCIVGISLEDVIIKGEKYYCSEGCAEGHKTIQGCSHSGCSC
ncbi:metallothionein [Scytonema sp. NUACC21]